MLNQIIHVRSNNLRYSMCIHWNILTKILRKCTEWFFHKNCKSYQESYSNLVPHLTHWGRVTHICVSKLTIIGSDNGLSPDRRRAIILTNVGISLIGPLGTKFNEILFGIQTFSFKKMHFKMSSAEWRPFCLGLNVLKKSLWLWQSSKQAAFNFHHIVWCDYCEVKFLQNMPNIYAMVCPSGRGVVCL